MQHTCAACGETYDDARCSTLCPHRAFLTEEQARQKDTAIALLGRLVHFNHQPGGPYYRVTSVGWDGAVTLHRLTGEFHPDLFTIKPEEEST